jgi:hypothetical protein
MNIFYTNPDSFICATEHCNVHQNKMIIEYAQMLSTAHRVLDGTKKVIIQNKRKKTIYELNGDVENILYVATHVNHLSAVWVRESSEHYIWLYNTFVYLCLIYEECTGKQHKTSSLISFLDQIPNNIDNKTFIEPPLAMPEEFHSKNILQSYKSYVLSKYRDWLSRERKIKVEWFYNKPDWAKNIFCYS